MSDALWPAPHPSDPVRAVVDVPGSKSLTNRALVLAALADTPTTVERPLRARDSALMVAALRSLGIGVDDTGPTWVVDPGAALAGAGPTGHSPSDPTGPDPAGPAARSIDCGLAGTVMRFVPPLAALVTGDSRFDGDPHARNRPMRPLLDGLRQAGAEVTGDGLPLTVHGRGGVDGGVVHIDASTSSQFVSALLLAGCRFRDGLTVHHEGPATPSLPHIEMTLVGLRAVGVDATRIGPASWQVRPGVPTAPDGLAIEPDLSNAGVFLAAALVTGGSVTVPGWPMQTSQPGDLLRGHLQALGGTVELDERGCTVTGSGTVHATDLDLSPAGELAPVLVALLALADGPSTVTGIAHLRGHETDRLAALSAEINGLGGAVTETADGLHIRPRPLHAGTVHTYADHRMAQAGAVLGLAVPGVQVEDVGTTSKTLPDFVGQWTAMLEGSPAS